MGCWLGVRGAALYHPKAEESGGMGSWVEGGRANGRRLGARRAAPAGEQRCLRLLPSWHRRCPGVSIAQWATCGRCQQRRTQLRGSPLVQHLRCDVAAAVAVLLKLLLKLALLALRWKAQESRTRVRTGTTQG